MGVRSALLHTSRSRPRGALGSPTFLLFSLLNHTKEPGSVKLLPLFSSGTYPLLSPGQHARSSHRCPFSLPRARSSGVSAGGPTSLLHPPRLGKTCHSGSSPSPFPFRLARLQNGCTNNSNSVHLEDSSNFETFAPLVSSAPSPVARCGRASLRPFLLSPRFLLRPDSAQNLPLPVERRPSWLIEQSRSPASVRFPSYPGSSSLRALARRREALFSTGPNRDRAGT